MAGTDFNVLLGLSLFLFTVWALGRIFRKLTLPSILGEFLAGVLLGPQFLDIVPFASNGRCKTVIFDDPLGLNGYALASGSASGSYQGRALAGEDKPCVNMFRWFPRWSGWIGAARGDWAAPGDGVIDTNDFWSFAGTVGVTLLIMESGMHINFEKVKQIGGKALIVAIVGTALPLIVGMLLVAGLYGGDYLYPDGFAAGCALAPTSVGISIKLLSDAKMLNSMAGQTTLTAAFVDDVFSLVLLVLLTKLSSGNAEPVVIIGLMIAAFVFLFWGVIAAKHVYPRLDRILSQFHFVKGASIQPRDEIHLAIMLGSLVLYSWIGYHIGSHLLGAFVAGMCFVNVPRSHQIWVTQLKRIIRWLIRIFFAATVGFAVPVDEMKDPDAILKGAVLGLLPGILCKVASGLAARRAWSSQGEKARASAASVATRFGIIQPIQYLVGIAMVARGEFAFLVAYSARNMELSGGGYMLSPKVYAAITWALVWALVFAPFLFKWALNVYMLATPTQRGQSIGGMMHASRNFVIQVVGQHHSGVLHEILNSIHAEGMDVLEARVETDGDVDINYFVVQSRGKQKDFDDEKLQDIRHHITEILGDPQAVVMFEAVEDNELMEFTAMEVAVVSDGHSKSEAHVVSLVTKRLQELGLDVEEIDEQHKIQIDHGHETEMERDLFYAVPSKNHEDGGEINRQRVTATKRALVATLHEAGVKAEVVIKPVADRSKGFTELQTFDPQEAVMRAKGQVLELICLGPHNVELLSTAVRKLEPLGTRLLHAAHTHADDHAVDGRREQCSRFFVEVMPSALAGKTPGGVSIEGADEDTMLKELCDKITEVLTTTYKTSEEIKIMVKPVDPEKMEEMSTQRRVSKEAVPGLSGIDAVVTPEENATPDIPRRGLPATLNLKEIPERIIDPRVAQMTWLDIQDGDELPPPASKPTRRVSIAGAGDLESRLAELEALLPRVARLEDLELHNARSGKTAIAASAPAPPKKNRRSREIDLPEMPEEALIKMAPSASKQNGGSSSLGLAVGGGSFDPTSSTRDQPKSVSPKQIRAIQSAPNSPSTPAVGELQAQAKFAAKK
jgi:Kef-type K+ transport system membrane component KefB/glycine cleavage system regulatory protein